VIPYHSDTFFTITTKELYEKAKFEYAKLVEDISPYNIFNFFVTAYHLKDYVKAEYDLNETRDIRASEYYWKYRNQEIMFWL